MKTSAFTRLLPIILLCTLFLAACGAAPSPTQPRPTPTLVPPSATATQPPVVVASPTLKPTEKAAPTEASALERLPLAEKVITSLDEATVTSLMEALTGETEVQVGGETVTLRNRNTLSEEDIALALQFATETLSAAGLTVSEQEWQDSSLDIRGVNLIAELPGSVKQDEIIVLSCHLDNEPAEEFAPGADDNASGCAAVLLAAQNLAGESFERTLRFVLLTGEEQGLLGSAAYAQELRANNDNVVAVLNMDMIGFDNNNDNVMDLYARPGNESDLAIVHTFINIIHTYQLGLEPDIIEEARDDSDTWSFWELDFPAILVIEDFANFNTEYHEVTDTVSNLNLPYLTRIIQAAVATAIHLAEPTAR